MTGKDPIVHPTCFTKLCCFDYQNIHTWRKSCNFLGECLWEYRIHQTAQCDRMSWSKFSINILVFSEDVSHWGKEGNALNKDVQNTLTNALHKRLVNTFRAHGSVYRISVWNKSQFTQRKQWKESKIFFKLTGRGLQVL